MSAVAVAQRYRGPADLFSPVIARDMWLTAIDTPGLCPICMGKPMRGEAPNIRLQRTTLRAAAEPER